MTLDTVVELSPPAGGASARTDSPGPSVSSTHLTNQATIRSSVLNLTNTVVGAGILSLPYFFRSTGIVLGLLLLALAGFLAWYGLHLLVRCGRDLQSPTFALVAQRGLPGGSRWVDLVILGLTTSVCIAYLVVVGELMPMVVRQLFSGGLDLLPTALLGRTGWITLSVIAVIPLVLLPRMDHFRLASLLSLLYIVALCGVIFIFCFRFKFGKGLPDSYYENGDLRHGCNPHAKDLGEVVLWRWDMSVIRTLPIAVFAFTCHPNIYVIQSELHDPSPARISQVITSTVLVSGGLYAVSGIFGYLTFRDQTCDDILRNYDESSTMILAARGVLCAVLLVHYAIVLYPARLCFESLAASTGTGRLLCPGVRRGRAAPQAFTAVLVLFTYVVALATTRLGTVFSLAGALGSSVVCFVMPAAFAQHFISPDRPFPQNKARADGWLGVFGALVMLVTPVLILTEG